MIKPTTFDITVATEVENAVMEVYGTERYEIYRFADSEVKKVVVFILFNHLRYDKFMIGRNYKMTYLYVPTVSNELEYWYNRDEKIKQKIDMVLGKVLSYEKKKNLAA